MRRDNTSHCIQLETKLSGKTATVEFDSNLISRNDELPQKMLSQMFLQWSKSF